MYLKMHNITCECCDDRCRVHKGSSICHRRAEYLLYRVDMYDETGTAFCTDCSEDAFESGLFTTDDKEGE